MKRLIIIAALLICASPALAWTGCVPGSDNTCNPAPPVSACSSPVTDNKTLIALAKLVDAASVAEWWLQDNMRADVKKDFRVSINRAYAIVGKLGSLKRQSLVGGRYMK